MLKQIKSDLSYIHQATDINLEIRSQAELDQLLEALQDPAAHWVCIQDRKQAITVHIQLRFREEA